MSEPSDRKKMLHEKTRASFARKNGRRFGGRLAGALAAVAGVCACLTGSVFAQAEVGRTAAAPTGSGVPPELEPFQGRPVRQIVFVTKDAAGIATLVPEADDKLAQNQLRLRVGAPFDGALVSDDIARLNRVGRFRRVESRVRQLDDGSVELEYTVVLQPLISAVQSVGNKLISDEDLLKMVDVLIGTPVDPTQLDLACRRIEARYKDRGYFNALVTVDEKSLADNGTVLFNVREGARTKVAEIRFEGNTSINGRELKGKLRTKEAWLLERGPVDQDMLADDVATITMYYRDRGFLDIRVDRTITTSPDGKEAIVTFAVEEGQVYTLRDIKVSIADETGASVFSPEQLLGLMEIKPGDAYSESLLKASLKSIKDAYGRLGFAEAEIVRRELREPGEPLVDTLLVVRQGNQFKTGLVEIRGNAATRDDVVRRLLTVQPDRPLDTTEIEESERRLRVARIFRPPDAEYAGPKLSIQPVDFDNPGYRDVIAEVEETNTGSFQFGAGFTSDGGVIGQFMINQRNFDILDTPDTFGEMFTGDAFRGGGQTATLAIMPGTQQQTFSVGLADPYLFDTDYSGSARAEWRRRVYRAYDESRYGAMFSIARRFGSQWTVRMPLTFQIVELNDIDVDAPTDYYDVEDATFLPSVGLYFKRSNVDDNAFPSRGTSLEFGVDQFFGDEPFQRFTAEAARYFRLDEDVTGLKTVLQLAGRIGYIPQDSQDVPFYERLYLGGQTFRGFAFRGIGPVGVRNDNGEISDDQVGGTFLFYAGAEIRQPVATDLVSLVAFVDTGTISDEVSLDDYRVSVGFGLRLYLAQISPVPLAFDFGFPIMKAETDRERLFTFSLDIPFN